MGEPSTAVFVLHDRTGLWLAGSDSGALSGYRFEAPDDLEVEADDQPIDALVRWARDEMDLLSCSIHTVATVDLGAPTHVFTVRIDTADHRPQGLRGARYVEAREVLSLIIRGEVRDAATIIAIQDLLIPRDVEHRAPREW